MKDRLKRLLTPADYTEQRLLMGGALVFCSAVVVQLIQIPPPQLTMDLKRALWAAAVAIPSLAGVLWICAAHERVNRRYATIHITWLGVLGEIATLACATAIFQHFSMALAFVFFALSVFAWWCVRRDNEYHAKINPALGDVESTHEEESSYRKLWYDAKKLWHDVIEILVFIMMAFCCLQILWLIAEGFL